MILSVMAAASAPLLIRVGSGRVLRGGSFSSAELPVEPGGGGNNDAVVVTGCVGRAILLEKICDGRDDEEMIELDRSNVATVVDVWVICGGATAPMPCGVGFCVNPGEEVAIVELTDIWLEVKGR